MSFQFFCGRHEANSISVNYANHSCYYVWKQSGVVMANVSYACGC